jgi:hypothetical protein
MDAFSGIDQARESANLQSMYDGMGVIKDADAFRKKGLSREAFNQAVTIGTASFGGPLAHHGIEGLKNDIGINVRGAVRSRAKRAAGETLGDLVAEGRGETVGTRGRTLGDIVEEGRARAAGYVRGLGGGALPPTPAPTLGDAPPTEDPARTMARWANGDEGVERPPLADYPTDRLGEVSGDDALERQTLREMGYRDGQEAIDSAYSQSGEIPRPQTSEQISNVYDAEGYVRPGEGDLDETTSPDRVFGAQQGQADRVAEHQANKAAWEQTNPAPTPAAEPPTEAEMLYDGSVHAEPGSVIEMRELGSVDDDETGFQGARNNLETNFSITGESGDGLPTLTRTTDPDDEFQDAQTGDESFNVHPDAAVNDRPPPTAIDPPEGGGGGGGLGNAIEKGFGAAAETEAEGGGPEDIFGDLAAIGVGIGTIFAGLKSQKPPDPASYLPTIAGTGAKGVS